MAKKKKRVYEYAKELGISSSELMHKLKFMGIRVGNTFNAVEPEVIEEIKRQMGMHLFEDPEVEIKKKKTPPPDLKERAREMKEKQQQGTPAKKRPVAKPPVDKEEKKDAEPEKRGKPETPKKKEEPAVPVGRKAPGEKKAVPQEEKKGPEKAGPKPDKKDRRKKRRPRKDGDSEDIELSKDEKGEQKKGRKKEKKTKKDGDNYSSPSKRLEAIKRKGLQKERKGQKTTFLKKRSKKDKKKDKEAAGERLPEIPQVRKQITVPGPMTVKEISHEMGVKSSDIIMFLMKELSLMSTLNQSLDPTVISLVAENFGCRVIEEKREGAPEEIIPIIETEDDRSKLVERPPVVTVLGHVDHGKTRLLDTIKKTNVRGSEFGGITQHIGAYMIDHGGRRITFLDTPGHEAFTQLRARGAKVTDLAVLVVAADDGVMPQTLEAIDHAREAKVPIMVAVNKIDKPEAKPDRVRQQLSEKDLIPEEWGGETVFVDISAKFNKNIEDLLEMVFLVVDMLELKANPQRSAVGTIIEAKLDKGKGPVATVLVQNGTLRIGDQVVVGEAFGKVRAMENDRGEVLKEAGPSTPVEIIGLNAVPEAGDRLIVLEDEKTAKEIAGKRQAKTREDKLRYESRISLEDLFNRIQEEKLKEFKIVLKADVQGSLEAITSSLNAITHEEVRVTVIRGGVGDIKETDIMLAAASNAVVMGYNVKILPAAESMAQEEKVEVRFYDIIYKLTDDVKKAMAGLLAPEYEKEFTGRVEVREIFSSSRVGNIAGCYVTEGEIFANSVVDLIRDEETVYEGEVDTLKRFKDNVKSVKSGYECGIVLKNFDDIRQGDIIEAYRLVEKRRDTI